MQKTITLLCFLTLTSLLYAQNFWQQLQNNKSIVEVADTGCPLYNAWDIEIEYQHTIGGEGNNGATDIDFTPDSNFIMLYGNNGSNFALYNEAGNELWNKKLLVNEDTLFIARQFIRIGTDYYISGYWDDYYTQKFGIMKTNEYGEKLWLKKIYEEPVETSKLIFYRNPSIIKVEDNNFLVSVELRNDLFVAKFDSSCNKKWELSKHDLIFDSTITDLDILFIGDQYFIYRYYLYSIIDTQGNVLSEDSLRNGIHFKIYFQNNNLYACGYENSEQWIRKYSQDFTIENEYRIGEIEYQRQIALTSDIKVLSDGSVLVYYDYSYMGSQEYQDDYNVQLLHLDKNLNCKSIINLYAAGSQYSNKLLITKNEDYILFGSGYYAYNERDMIFLARLNGWPLSAIEQRLDKSLKLYPNPATDELNIEFSKPFKGLIKIYSITGEILYQKSMKSQKNLMIELGNLKKGIYAIIFIEGNNTITKKLIKH